jgi:hypothetical protein
MDATTRKQINKVSITHFLLSFCAWMLTVPGHGYSAICDYFEWIGIILQPQIWFITKIDFDKASDGTIALVAGLTMTSVVLWSCSFGWLFVKTMNRFKDSSNFGRKVF